MKKRAKGTRPRPCLSVERKECTQLAEQCHDAICESSVNRVDQVLSRDCPLGVVDIEQQGRRHRRRAGVKAKYSGTHQSEEHAGAQRQWWWKRKKRCLCVFDGSVRFLSLLVF
jgi:hypothetical protein